MKKIVIILTFIALLCTLTACDVPKGSVVIIESISGSGFDIQFSEWDGQGKCKLSLNKGEELQVLIACEKGNVALDIYEKNGAEAYKGNSLESVQFTVKVPETGEYMIALHGEDASGSIGIKKALTSN